MSWPATSRATRHGIEPDSFDRAVYQVELDLTGSDTTFRSATTVRFTCARPGAATFIELTAPAVAQITLNGATVDPAAFDGDRIALAGLADQNELRVVATCAYSRTGEGLHRFADPVDKDVYLYSELETFDAHRIYACFDQPDLKATFEFTVTAPDGWQGHFQHSARCRAPYPRVRARHGGTSRPRRSCRPTSRPSRPVRTSR